MAVAHAVVEGRVDDQGHPVGRVPQAEVPERVARQVQELEPSPGAEADRLLAAQAEIDRRVAAEQGQHLGRVRLGQAVRLVPAVVLGEHRRVALDPAPVELVAGEQGARVALADPAVAARVVDVGVADQHQVRLDSGLLEGRDQHLVRRACEPGVDQHRPLLADEQVLGHRAHAEVGHDPVDARSDLLHGHLPPRVGAGPAGDAVAAVDPQDLAVDLGRVGRQRARPRPRRGRRRMRDGRSACRRGRARGRGPAGRSDSRQPAAIALARRPREPYSMAAIRTSVCRATAELPSAPPPGNGWAPRVVVTATQRPAAPRSSSSRSQAWKAQNGSSTRAVEAGRPVLGSRARPAAAGPAADPSVSSASAGPSDTSSSPRSRSAASSPASVPCSSTRISTSR